MENSAWHLPRRRSVPVVILAVVAALSLVACGSSKKKESTSATTAPPQPPEVAVTASEYSFALPPSIAGGGRHRPEPALGRPGPLLYLWVRNAG